MTYRAQKSRLLASLLALSLAIACQAPSPSGKATGSPSPTTAPSGTGSQIDLPGQADVKVSVKTIGTSRVTLEQTFTAQILAAKEVKIRSQASGYLESFNFHEGSPVYAGQVLFSIDPRSLQAQVKTAEAKVQDAEAKLTFARSKVNWKKALADQAQAQASLDNQQREVNRYKPLVERAIIPRQLFEQTVSARDVAKAQLDAAKAEAENTHIRDNASVATAKADLAAAQAALESARINLSYTTISSPITGVIGQLNVTPGNLVNPGQDVLATISSTDPIYVEFAISEATYLYVARQREATGQIQSNRIYQLILADGKPYDKLGKFSMIDRTVDPQTGTIKVRLEYPNAHGVLKPGTFTSVKLDAQNLPHALTVPQRAIMQLQSSNFVYIVDDQNKIVQREVALGESTQNSVVISKGLKAGERVVVDGMGRVKPGMTVSVEEAK